MIYESVTIKTRIIASSEDDCGAAVTTKTVVRVNGFHVQVSRSTHSKLVPPIYAEHTDEEYEDNYEYAQKEAYA